MEPFSSIMTSVKMRLNLRAWAQKCLLTGCSFVALFLTGCGFDDADNSTVLPAGNFVGEGDVFISEDSSAGASLQIRFTADIPADATIIYGINTVPGADDALEGFTVTPSSNGADYDIALTTAGQFATLTVTPKTDDLVEEVEFLELSLSTASIGVSVGSNSSRKVYILDVPPSVETTKPTADN